MMLNYYKIDKVDKQIINFLSNDARMPYTEIAKIIGVSVGTVHGRVKKLEDAGIIKGATLTIDYVRLGYRFIAYVGIFLRETYRSDDVIKELYKIPEVTIANVTSGQFSIFSKIRCRDTQHAKKVIDKILGIKGIRRTESMIALEESFNSKQRLISSIFDQM
ncbi:MAG: winged helix-turn-helix transcriptional regulator [Cytophagales bacterium]